MASSLNHTHIKARVQNPYLIYDENGQNQLKLIPYLWHAKQLKNVPYPLGPTYPYSPCKGVPPPPPLPGLLSKLLWRRSISQKGFRMGLDHLSCRCLKSDFHCWIDLLIYNFGVLLRTPVLMDYFWKLIARHPVCLSLWARRHSHRLKTGKRDRWMVRFTASLV